MRNGNLLERESRRVVGSAALDCGHVPLNGSATKVNNCVNGACAERRAFKARWELVGIDAQVEDGPFGTADDVKRTPDCLILRLNFEPQGCLSLGVPLLVKHHDHRLPLSGTFVVKCLGRNSRSKFPPTRPARPTAALLKTRLTPLFACG
jgi:hypothetical protein